MNSEQVKEVTNAIKELLSQLETKFECVMEIGKPRHEGNELKVTLTCKMPGRNGETPEQLEFERNCENYGLTKYDYLRKIKFAGQIFQLFGFNTRAKKYCCLARDDFGEIQMELSQVKEGIIR